jgi:hypothetical protein
MNSAEFMREFEQGKLGDLKIVSSGGDSCGNESD